MTLHTIIQKCVRVTLAALSFCVLGTVIFLITLLRFDVVSTVLFRGFRVVIDDDNVDNISELPSSWIPFLGGEFVMAVLLPLGVYSLWLSKPTSVSSPDPYDQIQLFPVGMFVAILLGLLAAHGVLFRYCTLHLSSNDETGTERMERKVVVNNTRWILFLLCVVLIRGGTCVVSLFEKWTTKNTATTVTNSKQSPFYWPVLLLVKLQAVLQIITAVAVISMGMTTVVPKDLLGKLQWEGWGHRYNLIETFGQTIVLDSFPFFYVILCTMMATIFQTLFVGIWILHSSPLSFRDTSLGLTASCVGVSLIIVANTMTIRIYNGDYNGFLKGNECMIGHILLLMQANLYLPLVWLIYHFAYGLGVFSGTTIIKVEKTE